MKVKIGPYRDWVGPYQIAEKILFWRDKHNDDSVHAFGTWLAGGERKDSILMKLCTWVESKKKRKVKIHIDKYDTWNMDSTLALIILPMLKQLRDQKHGSSLVDDEDLPYELRTHGVSDSVQYELKFETHEADEQEAWDLYVPRWDYVMGEMIWAFEQLQPDCDWESQYYVVNPKADVFNLDNLGEYFSSYDNEGRAKHQARISNGLRLFGKYYQGLWD